MSLSDWSASGLIVDHETSPEEIQGLLGVVERSLNDAKAQGLSADGRFSFAYNAALQCAAAALAAAGYRPGRSRHHYYAIESLKLTMGESEKQVRMLDAARKKREKGCDAEDGESSAWFSRMRDALNDKAAQVHPKLAKDIAFKADGRKGPSIYEVLGTSLAIMELQITEKNLELAEPALLIRPELADFTFMQFDRTEEAIEAGYEATRQALKDWDS